MAVPTSTPPTEEERIPRPANMFFMFRKWRQAQLKELGSEDDPALPARQQNISKRLSVEWKLLPDQERQEWKRKAEEEKRKHKELHPNYKYKPKNKEQKEADRVLEEEKNQKKRAAAAAAKESKKRPRAPSMTKRASRARKSKALSATASASSSSIASSSSSTATASSSSSAGSAASASHVTAPSWSFDGAPSPFAAGPFTVSPSTAPSSELATPSPVDHRAINLASSGVIMPYAWQAPALLDGAAFPTAVLGAVYDAQNTIYGGQDTYGAQNTMSLHTMNDTEAKDPSLVYVQNYGYMDAATAAMYADITEDRYNDRVDYNGQPVYYAASGSLDGTSSDDSLVAGVQTPAAGSESYSFSEQNQSCLNASSGDATHPWDHYLTPEDLASSGYDVSLRYPASLSRTASDMSSTVSDMSSSSMGSSAPQATDYGYSSTSNYGYSSSPDYGYSSSPDYDHPSSTSLASQRPGSFDFASNAAGGGTHASTDFDYSSTSQMFNARDTYNNSSFGGMPINSDFDAVTGAEGGIDHSELFVNTYAPSITEGDDALFEGRRAV